MISIKFRVGDSWFIPEKEAEKAELIIKISYQISFFFALTKNQEAWEKALIFYPSALLKKNKAVKNVGKDLVKNTSSKKTK